MRVAFDELGVKVSVDKLIGYIEYPSVLKNNGFDCPVGLAFLCTAQSDVFSFDDQASDGKFFRNLPKNMIIEQKEFLETHL